jgi:hypothetical protein
VVAHAFNPSTRGRDRRISEFEASLVYKLSPGQPGLQRNPASKQQQQQQQQKFRKQKPTKQQKQEQQSTNSRPGISCLQH